MGAPFLFRPGPVRNPLRKRTTSKRCDYDVARARFISRSSASSGGFRRRHAGAGVWGARFTLLRFWPKARLRKGAQARRLAEQPRPPCAAGNLDAGHDRLPEPPSKRARRRSCLNAARSSAALPQFALPYQQRVFDAIRGTAPPSRCAGFEPSPARCVRGGHPVCRADDCGGAETGRRRAACRAISITDSSLKALWMPLPGPPMRSLNPGNAGGTSST